MPKLNEKDFRSSAHRIALGDFLRTETGEAVLDILRNVPSSIPLGPNGLHQTDAVLARVLAESVGVNRAVSHLIRLAEPMPQEINPLDIDSDPNRPDGFDYLPEPLKQALRDQYKQAKSHE